MCFCCCSITKPCLTFWEPMNCRTPGILFLHFLLKFTQTHVHWVTDAIQTSHPLSLPSPPALNLSQHQGLLQWVDSLHQVAKLLELQLQHQSFQWIFRVNFFLDWLIWSPCSPRDSQDSSPVPQFKSITRDYLYAQKNQWLLSVLLNPIHMSLMHSEVKLKHWCLEPRKICCKD